MIPFAKDAPPETTIPPKKSAGVVVIILSVEATPVNPVPSPTKLTAVTIPENDALPFALILAAEPTQTPPSRVAIPE